MTIMNNKKKQKIFFQFFLFSSLRDARTVRVTYAVYFAVSSQQWWSILMVTHLTIPKDSSIKYSEGTNDGINIHNWCGMNVNYQELSLLLHFKRWKEWEEGSRFKVEGKEGSEYLWRSVINLETMRSHGPQW